MSTRTEAAGLAAPLMKGEELTPAPPTKFRCNRARMVLSIRVTLHHIAAAQINLATTPTTIKLDTLKARRKFKLHRVYPRGMECDDTQTTAKMEGDCLVVEMPITKLPPIGEPEPTPAVARVQPATKRVRDAEQPAKKRKRGSDAGADGLAGSSAATAPKKPKKAASSASASSSGGAGQQEREQQKQKLLKTFRKQQAASKAEKHTEQKKTEARKA